MFLPTPARAQVDRLPTTGNRPPLKVPGGHLDPYVSRAPVEDPLPLDIAATWPGVVPAYELPDVLVADIRPAGYTPGESVIWPASATTGDPESMPLFPYDYPPPEEIIQVPTQIQPRRPGAFQEFSLIKDFILQEDMGQISFELSALFGIPAPTRESPLLIKPLFQLMLVEGPTATEMPPRLYDTSIQFRWLRQLNERWGMELSVTPGIYGDYEQLTVDALRIAGHGGVKWNWTPDLALVAGIVYFDREDIGLLPVGGVIWTPRPDLRFDLVPPRPRIAWRTWCCDDEERWHFLAGEFGGGSWQIERTGGINDIVTLRDYRIILGTERKKRGWTTSRFEVGYVFWREIEYVSGLPSYYPGDTVLFRFVSLY